MTYTIRRAERDDIPRVIYINMKCLPENYPDFFFYYHLDNWNDAFFVAEVSNVVVGYIMNRIERGIGFFKKILLKKGHVVSIAVLEEYRKRGIGEALMIAGMNAMKNIYDSREAYLEVRVSNYPAIRLYEKLGFKIIKVIEGYYNDGENAYLMAREL